MKRKLSFLLLYGTLVLFGGLGALLLIFGEKVPHASQAENRMLAGFPECSWDSVKDGSFMLGLEDYLSDNVPDREIFVAEADNIMDRLSLPGEPQTDADAEAELIAQLQAFDQEDPDQDDWQEPTFAPTPADVSEAGEEPQPSSTPEETEPGVTPEPTADAVAATEAVTEMPAPTATPVPEKDLSGIQTCYFTMTQKDGNQVKVYSFPPENIRRAIRILNAYRATLPADGHVFFAQPPAPRVAANLRNGSCIGWDGDLEDTVNAYVDEGVYMISVQKVLEQRLLDGEYLFFTTDHHWTPRAACYTANAILETMGVDPRPYDSYSFTVNRSFYGSASLTSPNFRSSHQADTLDVLIPDTPVKGYRIYWDGHEAEAPLIYTTSRDYTVYLGGTLGPWRRFETGVDAGRSCLVIGDSFANCFLPFLTPYYTTVHMTDVRTNYYDAPHARWTISQYIADNGIDDVYIILSTAQGVNTVRTMDKLLKYL